MSSNLNLTPAYRVSENLVLYRARAKYIPCETGLRLASVCEFSQPVFNPTRAKKAAEIIIPEDLLAYGVDIDEDCVIGEGEISEAERAKYRDRAVRRAKTAAFDIICCNPDLNAFVTLTFAPEYVDRTDYNECYVKLKVWLSNRVSRKGLKYVCVPEHHKDGEAIHFHMICNDNALSYVYTGMQRRGNKIFNLTDWKWGFSTMMLIGESDDDRTKVSKYIYKYMGKQLGQKIGGRHYLHGGRLEYPIYVYGESLEELAGDEKPVYTRSVDITSNTSYREVSFV